MKTIYKESTMMTKADYIGIFQRAIEEGTFLTDKHHPSGVGVTHDRYRTVTVQDPSGLYDYLGTGEFILRQYHNSRYPQTPEYIVLCPNAPEYVAGSGIPPHSVDPTHPCDCLVVASGMKQGWHVHAEQQSEIDTSVDSGRLTYLGEVT